MYADEEVKIKLSLCLIEYHHTKTCGVVEVLILRTRWRWVFSFTLRPLHSEGKSPGTHWIGGWVGSSADLDAVVTRKITSPWYAHIRECIQKFPDWAPGARTANGIALLNYVSCIAILWVSLASFPAITICVASQRVLIFVSLYFVIDSVRKLLDTPSYDKEIWKQRWGALPWRSKEATNNWWAVLLLQVKCQSNSRNSFSHSRTTQWPKVETFSSPALWTTWPATRCVYQRRTYAFFKLTWVLWAQPSAGSRGDDPNKTLYYGNVPAVRACRTCHWQW
jgi:hypothetical protein